MYIDGTEVGSNSGGVVNLRSNISTYAGGDLRDNTQYFSGNIDEISIYDVALSQK